MWARFDDRFWSHRKVIAAGNEAAGAFVRIVCCCAERLSDGAIDDATAMLIAGRRKVLDRLVEVGMLEPCDGGGYAVHDYRDWQPCGEETAARRSELSAKRAAAGRRGAVGRWQNGKTDGKPDGNGDGKPVATPRQTDGPVPVSSGVPTGTPSGDGKPPTDPGPVKTPPTPAKKPRKEPRDPPPFSIGEAFEALASTSQGRFAPGVDRDWTKGIRIAVAGLIRQYPNLDAWKTVGAWLAAGGEHFRGVVGPSWAAGTTMANAMALAMDWHGKGRGPVRPESRNATTPGRVSPARPTPARALAPRRSPEEEQRLLNLALDEQRRVNAALNGPPAPTEPTHV